MPRLTIDQRPVEVPPGATVLDAARLLGIDVPMLCYRDGCSPSTSCLVCMVKLAGSGKLVPACGTPAEDGMAVESETDEVHQVRRSALELLLSDHLGDCLAPCLFACPAEMDIPKMLRQIAAGDLRGAIATVKADIALPAVLGRICPAPCEKTCRRTTTDGAVAICQLKRFVADADLATPNRYVPPCDAESGKRVAIIGGGPTGLAAAYYLRQQGHACTIYEQQNQLGGRLRSERQL
ncbi:MAG: FAD-dependent oxidoreductase, partial [Planctomycetota bacterium]